MRLRTHMDAAFTIERRPEQGGKRGSGAALTTYQCTPMWVWASRTAEGVYTEIDFDREGPCSGEQGDVHP